MITKTHLSGWTVTVTELRVWGMRVLNFGDPGAGNL